jgi:hypothetical protein
MAKSILNAEERQSFSEFPKAIYEYALLRYFTLTTDEQLAHIFPTTTALINMLEEYTFHDEPALITDINELPTVEPWFEQLDLGL